MLWNRNFGLVNLAVTTGLAFSVCNCSGNAHDDRSAEESGGASGASTTHRGGTDWAGTDRGDTGGGKSGTSYANANSAGASATQSSAAGSNNAGVSAALPNTAGTSGANSGDLHAGNAGRCNGGTNSPFSTNVDIPGMGSAGANSAGIGSIVTGGAAGVGGDIFSARAGSGGTIGIVVTGAGTQSAGIDCGGTNSAGMGSAGSPMTIARLANPIHVAVGASLAEADGSEAHPFPGLGDAVIAIRASEATATPWDGQIVVHEGRYDVPTTVDLPPNADIKFLAGVTLAMGSAVSLHANRDVKVLGTEEKQVVFTWLEQDKPWASFTLFVPASQTNEFAWATFEHGGEVTYQGISVRGALSLEGAGARISHCTFQNNSGDDGLSLGNSPSKVDHSSFLHNSGDGIDIDGPAGQEIAFCTFDGNGNDGLDLGEGADVWAHDNRMLNSGDTGIEIGEASRPTLDHNLCVGNSMGIGIKDDADPLVSNCTIYGNQYGIVAYHFKADYGSGKGSVSNTIVAGSVIADVALVTKATTTFSYSCIPSGTYSTTVTVGAVTGAPATGKTLALTGEGLISQGAGCDDPRFVGAILGDFHLMSTAGHWSAADQGWVLDAISSPCIDSGNPLTPVGAEVNPNGGRIDMGIYGGRTEASHSP